MPTGMQDVLKEGPRTQAIADPSAPGTVTSVAEKTRSSGESYIMQKKGDYKFTAFPVVLNANFSWYYCI